ncbi:major facilitator superfamily domain-containing protein [Microdochium trichocladiopsis]|uniref:Major facilitator superfamily domain-containing protein n=1 Tax=Microdochium trichocladiopsis TaxID=1682393 RepID=A0A9P9BG33_9PEZI|nr:major facilitator superfamily domain-containing protein [Microdochium trichocladiopsis]KAH7014249.1 major facilitator superfamily domain-containing protein [Microdochium trichocladiopsis]
MDNGPVHDSVFADKKTASDSENGVAGSGHKEHHGDGPPPPDDAIEASILKKLDRRIIPMACWIYLMNFMDRVGIGNARLFGLEQDLNLEPNQYQICVSILFVTYCLLETPSNLIIKRLQPARYIAGLLFFWGLIATFTGFVQNFGSMVACRLLLGAFEAGLFPGIMLYLTMFYHKKHISLRNAYFYSISAISGAVGGLVSYGIGHMDNDGAGTAGWRAWRWILTINGIPTVLTALVVPFVLPNSPETAKFLTEEDRRNLIYFREAEVGQTKSAQEMHKEDVMEAIKDWKIWALSIAQFCSHSVLYSFSVFLPTIIKGMGQWGDAQVQALTVPVYFVGFVTYLTTAHISDKTQQRGLFCMIGGVIMMIGYAMLVANYNVALSFTGCFFVSAGLWTGSGAGMAWITVNQPRYGKRAFASGVFITIGNSAGVASPFLFVSNQGPRFIPGYSASIGMLAVAFCIHLFVHLHFKKMNKRKLAGLEDWRIEGKTEEEIAEMGEHNPRYLYTC